MHTIVSYLPVMLAGICFLLSGGFVIAVALRRIRGVGRYSPPGTVRLAALAVGMAILGAIALSSGVGTKVFQKQAPSEKAAAKLTEYVRANKHVRVSYLSGFPRGEKDKPVDFGKQRNEPEELSAEDTETACRLITALTAGDLDGVQAIIASYAGKPFARAQIGQCISRTFYELGVRFRITAWRESFILVPAGLNDGQYGLTFSAKNEKPFATLQLRDKDHPRQFSSGETDDFTAREVMKSIASDIVHNTLSLGGGSKD